MTLKKVLFLIALFTLATPMFAQGNSNGANWVAISAGFSMAIAAAGCGIGQGKAIASACEGIARNPGAATAIRGALILGLALIESLALYVLIIIFIKVV
ncbi:MAG: ATP synthase F0 subunit C [Acidobacteria bacterium]|nr:ATP synthase F0 subunit C [Acidobacteriota bacterium]